MNHEEIKQNKRELKRLVEEYGFYKVLAASEVSATTLGLYLDTTNERYMSPRTLKLVRMTLL